LKRLAAAVSVGDKVGVDVVIAEVPGLKLVLLSARPVCCKEWSEPATHNDQKFNIFFHETTHKQN
jgi:hypothetical protein